MIPVEDFTLDVYCPTCKANTDHLIHFVSYDVVKHQVKIHAYCYDCRERAENLGEKSFTYLQITISATDFNRITPLEDDPTMN